jgi:transposase-like protein
MTEWANRPLDLVYPVIFIDAIVVKVRDGQVRNKPIYVVVGVTVHGERDILGLWAGDGGEGAKFWLQVLTELKNRGVNDVCIAVCDGLKDLPDAITTVWELAVVQASSVHHGCGGRVPSVTRAVSVRTCADVLPSRSRCRPVRPGRWRALHLPAGAAPG